MTSPPQAPAVPFFGFLAKVDLLHSTCLSSSEKAVLIVIAKMEGRRRGRCDASNGEIGRQAGLTERTVRSVIEKLSGDGGPSVILKDARAGRSSLLTIEWEEVKLLPGRRRGKLKAATDALVIDEQRAGATSEMVSGLVPQRVGATTEANQSTSEMVSGQVRNGFRSRPEVVSDKGLDIRVMVKGDARGEGLGEGPAAIVRRSFSTSSHLSEEALEKEARLRFMEQMKRLSEGAA